LQVKVISLEGFSDSGDITYLDLGPFINIYLLVPFNILEEEGVRSIRDFISAHDVLMYV